MERGEEADDGESIGKFIELMIPLDLIPDILLRLPAKSAVRFRCVSKLWSSILTRPDFIRSFSIQSSTRKCFLVCVIKRSTDKRLFISFPQHELPDTSSYSRLQRYQMNSCVFEYQFYQPLSESVHGLLCLGAYGRYTSVWNPDMRQQVVLPEVRLRHKGCFLGYDPVEGKHKVLFISARVYHEPLVLTLEPKESWRVIQNSPKHYAPHYNSDKYISVCINGRVYYQAELLYEDGGNYWYDMEEIVMSFDVRYETFNRIRKPDDPTLGMLMLNYEGKLAWFCSDSYSSSTIRFWVLEDEDTQEWSLRNFLLPIPNCSVSDTIWKDPYLYLKGIMSDTGEFIFAERTFTAIYVLYYDPKRNHTRKVKYEGIGDEELWDDNDLKKFDNDDIHLYPNHSESLCSLENVPCYVSPIDSE